MAEMRGGNAAAEPSTTTVRADHVGSLLRPERVLVARREFVEGTISAVVLEEVENEAILEVLASQQELGLDVVTDGEFRRASWVTEMAAAVDGFVAKSRDVRWYGPGGGVEASTSKVVGAKLERRRRLAGSEVSFLDAHAPKGRYKITLPAPSNFFVMGWQDGVTDQAYESRVEMMADVVAIVRGEIEELLDEGVSYVQMDSPYYSVFFDEPGRAQLRAAGIDPDDGLAAAVAFDNACIAGLSRNGVTLALHVCRGNSKGRWLAEGSYDPVAETLFGSLEVDRFLLEYDSARDGGFEPLRFLSGDTMAVLGLVTTKEPELETPDALIARIEDASRFVDLERLALSPQCGFASVAEGNPVPEDAQWRKLALVVDVARRLWG